MGLATPHALGRQLRFYAKAESTYGTFTKPAATDAAKVTKTTFDIKQKRNDRMDTRQTRSLLERITDRKEVTWSAEAYIIPSGAAGTAPDLGPLFIASCGVETVNSSTSVVYTGTASQSVMGSCTLVREMSSVYMEALAGAAVETLKISMSGASPAKVSFEGFAADHYGTGYTTLNGSLSGGETSVPVHDGTVYEANSVVKIGTSDNSGAGHTITAVSGNTLTVSPAVSGAQSNSAAVIPFVPTETVAGSPIAGITGALTLDGSTLLVTAAEISWKNNQKPIADEAFSAVVTDYIPGFREVSGSLTVRGRRDVFTYWAQRKSFGTHALVWTCGSVSGKKLTVSVPYAEIEFAPLEIPESEELTFQLPFRALGSSGEDEATFTFL